MYYEEHRPSSKCLQVIPRRSVVPKFNLEDVAFNDLSHRIFVGCTRIIREEQLTSLKNHLGSLPLKSRVRLLEKITDEPGEEATKLAGPFTRREYLRAIENAWKSLYESDFPSINIPNIQGIILSRCDILTSKNDEVCDDNLNSMNKLLSDCFASILRHIRNKGSNSVRSVSFSCYSQRIVGTMAEKAMIFSLIENFSNVRVLDLGFGCDDSILREVGRLCRHVVSLTFSGTTVTDKGIQYLCGFLDMPILVSEKHEASDICKVLKYLDISSANQITPEGIRTILFQFSNLQRLKCQDTYLLRALNSISSDPDFVLPLRYFEYGMTNNSRSCRLPSGLFPQIRELVLWSFDINFENSFPSLADWKSFPFLTTLRFNRVRFFHLIQILKIIGNQIVTLELDNFTLEPSGAKFDIGSLSELLPKLSTLSLTTCHIWASCKPKLESLEVLNIRGVSVESEKDIFLILSAANFLRKFLFVSLVDVYRAADRKLDDELIKNVFRQNNLTYLESFIVSALDLEVGPIKLTEQSLFLLIERCRSLKNVGNLYHWSLWNHSKLFSVLKNEYDWIETSLEESYYC